ncbi:MAG: exo-rhamnogalacturonan lyase family protein [Kiritimatiellia bacterium]
MKNGIAWIMVTAFLPLLANALDLPSRPGELDLPLNVTEWARVDRRAEPVTGGVPLPVGLVHNTDQLRVIDPAGNVVPAQFKVMERWWKPAYDDSIRWLKVDFLADVPATESTVYRLRDNGQGTTPATPLNVIESTEEILVTTGPLRFSVSKTAFNVIDKAWFDLNGDGVFDAQEQMIYANPENGGVILSGEWTEKKLPDRTLFYSGIQPPRRIVIEERGPVRVTILAEGTHYARDPAITTGMYDYRVRIHAYAGKPFVRVQYALQNLKVTPTQYIWPMREFSVVTRVNFPGEHAAAFLMDNDPYRLPPHYWEGQAQTANWPGKAEVFGRQASDGKVLCYQDSSGGEQWKELLPNGHNSRVFGAGVKEVSGVTFRGFKIFKDGKEEASGSHCPGLCDLRDNTWGFMVVAKDFWQQYPKAIEAERGKLALKIFPAEARQIYGLEPGTQKTTDFLYFFHGPKLVARHVDWVWQRFNRPLRILCPVEWYEKIDCWDLGLARVAKVEQSYFDKTQLDGNRVGWERYGWISPWNPGGQHWNESSPFAEYVLRGDIRDFEASEICSLWAADLVPIHNECAEVEILRYWLFLRGWNRRESKVTLEAFPGWTNRRAWIGVPDSGHAGMLMWLEHYRLTGDEFLREAVERNALRGRAYSWSNNHDDPVLRVNWCRKRDPDDPTLLAFDRYTAWPLFNFLQGYSITGRLDYREEARTTAMAFRNAVRWSPVGWMCTYVNDAGSPEVYGRNYREEVRAKSASACYANFQLSLAVIALAKYYRETLDEEARDAITATVDVLVNRAMLRTKEGKPAGWTYCFGDLWGPNVASGGEHGPGEWNSDVLTAVGYGYQFTGRHDFFEVLESAYEATKWKWDKLANVAFREVMRPRRDRIPPGQITDLKAKPLGDGRIELTWTATGDNGNQGRAAATQVKYAYVPIVERVMNWPLPGEPLPKTKAEYHAMREKALKLQCSFYQAFNAKGELPPQPAGTREKFVLADLKPGRVWFAIKVFDAAGNEGQLSNVAEAEVR